jgi:hypothetical protein
MNIIIHVRGLPALLREEIGRRVAQQSEGMAGSFVMSAFDRILLKKSEVAAGWF